MQTVERLRARFPVPAGRWRQIRLLLLSTIAIGLIGGGGWMGWKKLSDPELLPVKVVGVEGVFHHMKQANLQKRIAPLVGAGLFAVDVQAVREAALELPWVEEVAIRRIWPDKLEITIKEFEPLARWGADSLINTEGRVFSPVAEEIPKGLPRLWGPEGSETRVTERYLEMLEPLQSLGMDVAALHLNERRSWSLQLRNGLQVELGQRNVEARFHHLLRIYPQLMEQRTGHMLKMDFRYPNGVAVAWSRGSFRK